MTAEALSPEVLTTMSLEGKTGAALPAVVGAVDAPEEDAVEHLRGVAKAIAANMDLSVAIPTATSVRAVSAKVLIENRALINEHLARTVGGKLTFTHLIGWAVVKALGLVPGMNNHY